MSEELNELKNEVKSKGIEAPQNENSSIFFKFEFPLANDSQLEEVEEFLKIKENYDETVCVVYISYFNSY